MRILVILNAIAKRLAGTHWTQAKIATAVTRPAVRDIAQLLSDDLKTEFSGPISASGGMAKGFGTRDLSLTSAGVEQTATNDRGQPYEQHIRQGTSGPYSGFPAPVMAWAINYRGKTVREAYAIAKSVQQQGTAKTFTGYYPQGDPRFEYTEWVVDVKHKGDVKDWAQQMGEGVVSFVTAGDIWKGRTIG